MCLGSRVTSNASTASICIRKASSNDWIRDSSCASFWRLTSWSLLSAIRRSSCRRCSSTDEKLFRMFSISFCASVCCVSM